MAIIFFVLFICSFVILAWKRFDLALAVLFLSLPTYLIRFHIGWLPSTVFEGMIVVVVGVWWKQMHKKNNKPIEQSNHPRISDFFYKNTLLCSGVSLFLLAATLSIFTSVDIRTAAGEWKTFYVEPIILFFIMTTHIQSKNNQTAEQPNKRLLFHYPIVQLLLYALIICGFITSLFAIYQHFTGFFVPHAFWANRNTYRVTGWYGFPNAVGLFLAPLVPLGLYLVKTMWENIQKTKMNNTLQQKDSILYSVFCITILFLPLSLLTIIYAKSTGGLVGVAAGIGFLFLFNKKTRIPTIMLGIIGLLSLMSFASFSGLRQELTLQDRSGQIRIAIWKETIELLKDRPFLGAGLASYEERIAPYHTKVNGEKIEIFHHPHNIFLTMWVNLGLLGLIGFILILVWFYKEGCRHLKQKKLEIFLLASMTALLVTGLVDSPYIKNDLSLFFWLLVALMVAQNEKLDITDS